MRGEGNRPRGRARHTHIGGRRIGRNAEDEVMSRRAYVWSTLALAALVAIVVAPDLLGERIGAALGEIADASPGWLWLAGASFVAGLAAMGTAWCAAIRSVGGDTTAGDSTARYAIGSLVNAFAPAGAGGATDRALLAHALRRGSALDDGRRRRRGQRRTDAGAGSHGSRGRSRRRVPALAGAPRRGRRGGGRRRRPRTRLAAARPSRTSSTSSERWRRRRGARRDRRVDGRRHGRPGQRRRLRGRRPRRRRADQGRPHHDPGLRARGRPAAHSGNVGVGSGASRSRWRPEASTQRPRSRWASPSRRSRPP